jgi:enamine deaminase RidA (YjgF/YER057c/UK114 family)
MTSRPAAATNPFGVGDPDRRALWDMLVARDIDAFAAGDFGRVAGDFDEASFSTVTAAGSSDPDYWSLELTELDDYKAEWLRQSEQFRLDFDDPSAILYAATTLEEIEIRGERALAHKRFDYVARTRAGARRPLRWRTLYQCRRSGTDPARWLITGFIGFLPLAADSSVGTSHVASRPPRIARPQAAQHKTAGAYSPVLRVRQGGVAVISGQAALDPDGNVAGADIESQTEYTLRQCSRLLTDAGLALADVFKVNVYLADIAEWAAFNRAYRRVMPGDPLPVRTAVGADLLPGLRVEIEMWAAG